MKRLLNENAACEYLSIGRSKLYQLRKAGRIKPVYVDTAPRFPVEELDKFVDKLKQEQNDVDTKSA